MYKISFERTHIYHTIFGWLGWNGWDRTAQDRTPQDIGYAWKVHGWHSHRRFLLFLSLILFVFTRGDTTTLVMEEQDFMMQQFDDDDDGFKSSPLFLFILHMIF